MNKVLEDLLVMKKTIQLSLICATLAMLALPAFANRVHLQPDNAPQDQCTPDNKIALYTDFLSILEKVKGGLDARALQEQQAKAYDDAKKYLACPADPNETDQQAKAAEAARVAYLQKWVARYEEVKGEDAKKKRKAELSDLVYNKKDYTKAYELGRQILADEPDYLQAYIDLGFAAFTAFNADNTSFAKDGATYAKKAIALIQSGRAPADWKQTTKDDALAKLNYWVGTLKQDSAVEETIPFWIKAASYDNFKKNMQLYYRLGLAYETSYRKMLNDYNEKYKDKEPTTESKLALENVNQMLDRTIDALARAVALAGSDAKVAEIKTDAMERLTEFYKSRFKSPAGIDEMIGGILSKPLPPEPTPITSLPATTPGTSGPGTGATPAGTNGGPSAAPGQPNKTNTTTKTGPTKPPKVRRAHARP